MKLPSKDSALGRALRVLGYQLAVVLVGFLLDPEVIKGIAQYYPQIGSFLLLGAPLLSLVYNVLRSDTKNL